MMYLWWAYQDNSPDGAPWNRAVESRTNHWMMQCQPWYVAVSTVVRLMPMCGVGRQHPFCGIAVYFDTPDYARGKPIIVSDKAAGTGAHFQDVSFSQGNEKIVNPIVV